MEVMIRVPTFLAYLLASSCGGHVDAAPMSALQTHGAISPAAVNVETSDTCDGMELQQKEACYAAKSQALIEECERMRINRCAPYARFHKLEEELQRVETQLTQLVKMKYAGYEKDQPGYVAELERALAASAASWRAFRDAHCSLEPMIQGMSISEAPDLAEACRADMTESHTKQISTSLSNLMDETQYERAAR